MQNLIELLQRKQWIWQGSEHQQTQRIRASGFAEWDNALQGFPASGVIEIQSLTGIGELRLFMPTLKQCSQQRLIVFINPPGLPNAHSLQKEGIAPGNLLIIRQTEHALWAAEQCLKSGCCACVCLWHPQLEVHQARRLQVAAEQGEAINLYFNHDHHVECSLPVPLSIQLSPDEQGLKVKVNKRRGGWNPKDFNVGFESYWPMLVTDKPEGQILTFPRQKRKHA